MGLKPLLFVVSDCCRSVRAWVFFVLINWFGIPPLGDYSVVGKGKLIEYLTSIFSLLYFLALLCIKYMYRCSIGLRRRSAEAGGEHRPTFPEELQVQVEIR